MKKLLMICLAACLALTALAAAPGGEAAEAAEPEERGHAAGMGRKRCWQGYPCGVSD